MFQVFPNPRYNIAHKERCNFSWKVLLLKVFTKELFISWNSQELAKHFYFYLEIGRKLGIFRSKEGNKRKNFKAFILQMPRTSIEKVKTSSLRLIGSKIGLRRWGI